MRAERLGGGGGNEFIYLMTLQWKQALGFVRRHCRRGNSLLDGSLIEASIFQGSKRRHRLVLVP